MAEGDLITPHWQAFLRAVDPAFKDCSTDELARAALSATIWTYRLTNLLSARQTKIEARRRQRAKRRAAQ